MKSVPPLRSRIWAPLLLSALFARPAQANTIVLPSSGEPNLLGPNGILDTLYGLANVARIDDSADKTWLNTGVVVATVVAKYAGLDQRFGYRPGATGGPFQPLFDVTTNCLGATCDDSASFTVAQSGPTFRFADRAGGITWSSRPKDNSHSADHMVSFLITGGPAEGAYVIAFEDLPIGGGHDHGDSHHGDDDKHHDKDDRGDDDGRRGKNHHGDDDDHHGHKGHHDSDDHGHHGGTSDRDYNDLVVQIGVPSPSEIPEPGESGLLGAGLLILTLLLRLSSQA
jgi:hypothetical protein